jgi:putative membrane protein
MIGNFGDHAANERTFLAWVRTAIAIMAFGFLVEKFDLFLELAAPSLAGRALSLPSQKFGNLLDWRSSFLAPPWSSFRPSAL